MAAINERAAGCPRQGDRSTKPVDRGGSVGSDEPPRLPNGPLEVFKNYYTGYF